ncbi:U3 snoRNP-associated protein-like YAOH [Zea mays]|uniref:U3 snoRNP-associated protein-like YAOH n=2 Tax=Zea mays TaxID=4577 RepID=A0A3L6EIC5_MAIZE|nr:U3 snoRNP-associated protein-like EMB2271 [Zea mays]PWZ20231.1 hypothetical protein Zm00014a_024983 [Zea mays]PWZ20232.1 hypothetical protein Zm00014a_024983 [Zea mays]PWZ20233.1 U3 snoRNP-associated protein-like YAOH [Zea mays]
MAPRSRKRASRPKPRPGSRRGGGGGDDDPFFESAPKRRRGDRDEDIESEDSDDDGVAALGRGFDEDGDEGGKEDEDEETVGEKKMRIAKEWLKKVTEVAKRGQEDDDEDENVSGGRRVAEILQRKQLEESGRKRREIAARVLPPGPQDGFKVLVKHRQPVTAVALSKDSDKGFSGSKDGIIMHWDVETGKCEKYIWPSEDVLVSHHAKPPVSAKRSKQVLALAASSDGRYLASGGLDRHIHLWDIRSQEHIQWNAEDRTYMNCLYGHQNEILTMDAFSKERILTVARDRTMHLWKIPEESQLVFRAPVATSLECCCFIDDKEFLSGSDDGSIELWSIMRKKPILIVKNAHPVSCTDLNSVDNDDESPKAQSWVGTVAARRGSDLAASGAGNGLVRLWAIKPDSKGVEPLFDLKLDGFVNSLAIAKSGRFIVAGVGQEPRLGRWGRVRSAQNGVAIHPIRLKDEKEDL